ncbi:hypothetical protein JCM10020v2_007033 [Rhodotorula toruloides]
MQSTRGRSVIAAPDGTDRFLVGGGAELRLYEAQTTRTATGQRSQRFTTSSVVSELAGLRAFAWAPRKHAAPPLVAAGLTTGRVLLLRMDEGDGRGGGKAMPSVQINVRHSRPCNIVTFCPDQPGLLAVGLEKGRGESLLVYDVQRSFDSSANHDPSSSSASRNFSLHRETSASGRSRNQSPARLSSLPSPSPSPSPHDPLPLVSFGSSEVITSAAFLASPAGPSASDTSPLLAAAMANKWLRVYDLRSPPSTVTTWSTRSIWGIQSNPFNSQQLTSYGDDGIVRLWDLRKPMDPLLSFSEVDAGSNPAQKQRANVVPRPLAETAWSSEKRGVFAMLERDGSALRVWNLVDGPGPRLVSAAGGVGAPLRAGGASGAMTGEMDAGVDEKDVLRMPIVLDDRKTRSFQQTPTSFAFASSGDSAELRFVGLSRDSANPGSSGQRLEIIDLPPASHSAFLERSILVSSSPDKHSTYSIPVGSSTLDDSDPLDSLAAAHRRLSISPATPALQISVDPLIRSPQTTDRGRTLSLAGLLPPQTDRNLTPRPSNMLMRRISSGGVVQLVAPNAADEMGLRSLSTDMSVVVRERVEAGYGSDPLVNAGLSDAGVKEFWLWVTRAQALSSEACVPDYDFRFRGVLRILLGFPSGMTHPNASASPTSSTHSSPGTSPRAATPRSIYTDITRSLRRGDEAQSKHAAYAAGCAQLVAKRKLKDVFAISSSQFAAQRKIALSCCGAEWEEGWEAVCAKLAKAGDHEGAARHAFFSGQLEKSMGYLRLCKDENLRMLAPIVAAYLAQKDSLRGSESNYASLCRSLSSDVETPWVRAMFAYLATSDWRELVDETGLALRDRVAVALRFLSDSELIPFLQDIGDEALSSSDLEAVVLFGLRNDGLKLLSSYVDRTADVQTVALACSFTSPGMIRADMRVTRWVETYRSQLDKLQLYAARAMFDAARGRRARAALEQARAAGRQAEAKELVAAMRKTAPPQILLRCQFCSTNISPPKGVFLPGEQREGRKGDGPRGHKASLSPSKQMAPQRSPGASAAGTADTLLTSSPGSRPRESARSLDATASAAVGTELVKDGHEVLVEKCAKRAIGNDEYAKAGARLVDTFDSSACDVVVGVKEPTIPSLFSNTSPNKPAAHLAFFHCHKGQEYNHPLLRTLLQSSKQSGTRFIDYELLTSYSGAPARSEPTIPGTSTTPPTAPPRKRTVGFGFLAGYSGMADGLAQLGTKLLAGKGVVSPFLSLPRPLQAGTVHKMETELRRVGEEVRRGEMGQKLGPIVIAVSGRGKVGDGARRALDELGVEWIKADMLSEVVNRAPTTIYACHLELADYLVDRSGKAFDREEYRAHPERFDSVFHEKIAPYSTVFLNGGFWAPPSPRLLTTAQLASLQQNSKSRLISIVDVSCDFGGGLEFVKAATTLDDPIVQYDAVSDQLHRDPAHPTSVQLSSVEILPSAFPLDATKHFSNVLLPYLRHLLDDPSLARSTGDSEIREALKRATLVKDGKLEKQHEWLYELLEKASVAEKRRKAVVLGAGLVAGPAVRTLAARPDVDVIVASNDLPAAEQLASGLENVSAVSLDAGSEQALSDLVASADVVLSLLPAPMHVNVAKLCIKHNKALVTASYVSPAMSALHESAKDAGVVLLNELGLDPGIDHITAMRLIHEAKETGNKIKSFVSFCGGLPAPEISNVPLGYKFSWSPRGVLTAALNSASFRLSGRNISIPGSDLLRLNFPTVRLIRGFAFEGVANRDSLAYLPQYGLDRDLPTILRGTLRYPGFSKIADAFKKMGLFDTETLNAPIERWTDLVLLCLRKRGVVLDSEASLQSALKQVLGGDAALAEVIQELQALSLVDSSDVSPAADLPPLPNAPCAPIDLLSSILANRLAYKPGERDAVVLTHEVTTESADGQVELFTSSLVQYGDEKASAMATTVGVPIALGALLYLDGKIAQRGVVSPASDEVWPPMLAALQDAGIRFVEGRRKGTRGVLEQLEQQVARF